MLHGLHAAFETSAPTEGGLTAVVLSRTHTSATVLADDCVRRSGAARRASASAIKAWCRADDSVAGLDIAFHSSGRRAAVADLGSGGTSKSSASASVPVSRSVILKGAVVVLVRGRGPHPAGRSAAAVAVRGEHCLPNSASRWGTPGLATPIRAVANREWMLGRSRGTRWKEEGPFFGRRAVAADRDGTREPTSEAIRIAAASTSLPSGHNIRRQAPRRPIRKCQLPGTL